MHARALGEAELPAQPSRYDSTESKPDDTTLKIMWIAWTCVSAIVALGCVFVLASIASCRKVRPNPFNFIIWLLLHQCRAAKLQHKQSAVEVRAAVDIFNLRTCCECMDQLISRPRSFPTTPCKQMSQHV
eukprot:6184191-Pleurochrysis_carterae.AAC.2